MIITKKKTTTIIKTIIVIKIMLLVKTIIIMVNFLKAFKIDNIIIAKKNHNYNS